MNLVKKRYSILVSEHDSEDQSLLTSAIAEINSEIEVNLVFTGEQLTQYLLRGKLGREINRQDFPNFVIASLKEPFFTEQSLRDIRQYEKLCAIPVYVLVSDFSVAMKERLQKAGANGVIKKPDAFQAMKELLEKIINTHQPKRLTKALFCSRCEEYIEFDPNWGSLAGQIKISLKESEFIKQRFDGPFCVPCLRQLQNSYRIISGNDGNDTRGKMAYKPEI